MSRNEILVIGLGEIGFAKSQYLTQMGLKPFGYDVSSVAENRALASGIVKGCTDKFDKFDTFIVCVSTHDSKDMNKPDIRGLFQILSKITAESSSDCLISIESTIPYGLAKKLEAIVGYRHLVHAPHRYYKYEADTHGVNQKRVIGGASPCCVERGMAFYQDQLKIPMQRVSSINTASLVKLGENADRYLKLSWAEQLFMMCQELGEDYNEVRKAMNSKWNVDMLEVRKGIGGHCLPKDTQMLIEAEGGMFVNSLLKTAQEVDKTYVSHLIQLEQEIQ